MGDHMGKTISLRTRTVSVPNSGIEWRLRRLSGVTLSNEIWFDILSRLPVKSLHVCRGVSRTWDKLVADVFAYLFRKGLMPQVPLHGLVLRIGVFKLPHSEWNNRCIDDIGDFYLSYISLADREVSLRITSRSDTIVNSSYRENPDSVRFLGQDKLKLDLVGLCDFDGKNCNFMSWHRGLLLTVPDGLTCHAYNPATKEVLVLPRSPSLKHGRQSTKTDCHRTESTAAIINLSDCLSSLCSFRVVRFSRSRRLVEVYHSDEQKWVSSKFTMKQNVARLRWRLMNSVFLDDTLIFLTDGDVAVALKLEQLHVHSMPLPMICKYGYFRSVLGESQGSLYLTYSHFPTIQIWNHSGDFTRTTADAWTVQFCFSLTQPQLCGPAMTRHLRHLLVEFCQSVRHRNSTVDFSWPEFIAFHPDHPIVYLYQQQGIFAFHFINDTLEEVAKLKDGEYIVPSFASPYYPCLASLQHVKRHGKNTFCLN